MLKIQHKKTKTVFNTNIKYFLLCIVLINDTYKCHTYILCNYI